MRGSSRPDTAKNAAVALSACLLFLFPPMAWSASPDLDFSVRHVDIRTEGETWLLDAGIDLEFNRESREAMESGVPLTALLEVEVVRERFLRDESVRRIRMPYRIERHALSQRYVVTYVPSGKSRTYGAIEDASAALGTIRGLSLVQRAELLPGQLYRARLRARLDIDAMPSPLRPLAWFRSLWRLRNDWFTWVLSS